MKRHFSLLFLLAAAVLPLAAAEQDPAPKTAEDPCPVAWLEGHWAGDGFGGRAEEVWLAPSGGTMACVFRLTVEGAPRFYELVTVGRGDDGWEMRLKHFHADLRGWEPREQSLVWAYEELGPREARFGPVTYTLSDDDVLTARVVFEHDGETGVAVLEFRRVR